MDDEVLLDLQSSTLCLDLIAWEGYSDRNRKRDETRGDEGDRDTLCLSVLANQIRSDQIRSRVFYQ